MHDGNSLMVDGAWHQKNGEYTAKPASRAALGSFVLRIYLEEPPRAALIEPSSRTIEARTPTLGRARHSTEWPADYYFGAGGA